ncbi:MAG: hypothetical protein ACJA1R_001022, partial [Flavobacteriales bacterium]
RHAVANRVVPPNLPANLVVSPNLPVLSRRSVLSRGPPEAGLSRAVFEVPGSSLVRLRPVATLRPAVANLVVWPNLPVVNRVVPPNLPANLVVSPNLPVLSRRSVLSRGPPEAGLSCAVFEVPGSSLGRLRPVATLRQVEWPAATPS